MNTTDWENTKWLSRNVSVNIFNTKYINYGINMSQSIFIF